MSERILIIGAKDSADIATAANVVRRFREHHDKEARPFGKRGLIIFLAEGVPGTVAVWHTAKQTTVCFSA